MQIFKFVFRSFLFSLLVAVSATGAARAADDRVGNWVVNKENCQTSAKFRNGQSLIIQIENETRYTLYLRSLHWELPDKYKETVLFWADKDSPSRAVARYLDSQTLRIAVSDPEWVKRSISHAHSVSFVFGEKTYRIPITHGERVMGWLAKCGGFGPNSIDGAAAQDVAESSSVPEEGPGVPHWMNLETQKSGMAHYGAANAAGTPAEPKLSPSLSPVRGSQALEFMMNVLNATNFKGAKVDIASASAPWPVKANAVWKRDQAHGAVRRYRQLTTDQLHIERQRLLLHDQNACDGRFRHSQLPLADRRLTSLITVCESPERQLPETHLYLTVEAANSESFMLMVSNEPLDIDTAWQSGMSFAVAALSAGIEWTERSIRN